MSMRSLSPYYPEIAHLLVMLDESAWLLDELEHRLLFDLLVPGANPVGVALWIRDSFKFLSSLLSSAVIVKVASYLRVLLSYCVAKQYFSKLSPLGRKSTLSL